MVTSGFQIGRIEFRPDGKKRGKVELPNGDAEKGIPQHIPKKVTSQGLSKESKLKEGKNEKTGNGTCQVIGTEQALLTIRRNRGTNGSPGMPEPHYKRRGRLRR